MKWRSVFVFTLVLIGGLYVLLNHSTRNVRLRCPAVSGPIGTVFVDFEIYRPWVMLWSDSDGNTWLELENGFPYYFNDLDMSDHIMRIIDTDGYQIGQYSPLSRRLTIAFGGNKFSGTCVEI